MPDLLPLSLGQLSRRIGGNVLKVQEAAVPIIRDDPEVAASKGEWQLTDRCPLPHGTEQVSDPHHTQR